MFFSRISSYFVPHTFNYAAFMKVRLFCGFFFNSWEVEVKEDGANFPLAHASSSDSEQMSQIHTFGRLFAALKLSNQ